jgi:hypothetical protein
MSNDLGSYAKPPLFVVESLQIPDAEMAKLRNGFKVNPVRGWLGLRLLEMIEEKRNALETVPLDKITTLQGEINGLKRAYALLVTL